MQWLPGSVAGSLPGSRPRRRTREVRVRTAAVDLGTETGTQQALTEPDGKRAAFRERPTAPDEFTIAPLKSRRPSTVVSPGHLCGNLSTSPEPRAELSVVSQIPERIRDRVFGVHTVSADGCSPRASEAYLSTNNAARLAAPTYSSTIFVGVTLWVIAVRHLFASAGSLTSSGVSWPSKNITTRVFTALQQNSIVPSTSTFPPEGTCTLAEPRISSTIDPSGCL